MAASVPAEYLDLGPGFCFRLTVDSVGPFLNPGVPLVACYDFTSFNRIL